MFKKLKALLGGGAATTADEGQQPPSGFTPYRNPAFNIIYNLLFCDNLDLFRANYKGELDGPWKVLFVKEADIAALRALAEDQSQESRIRMLAYSRLRACNERVPEKKLLGVIIEMSLDDGLDVLAAFEDGGARYMNHSEKMTVFETAPADIEIKIRKLLAASQTAVNQIGPWDQARLAPPQKENVRMTFLVSDGLYFGQGPIDFMEKEPMAAPIIAAGTELLVAIVNKVN